MAKPPITKYEPFYRGDTQDFVFNFTAPYVGYNWSNVSLDCSMTNVTNPTDNSGAAAFRINQMLTVDALNNASYTFSLERPESLTLQPGTKYMIQHQLKETISGKPKYRTPMLGVVEIYEDYVI